MSTKIEDFSEDTHSSRERRKAGVSEKGTKRIDGSRIFRSRSIASKI